MRTSAQHDKANALMWAPTSGEAPADAAAIRDLTLLNGSTEFLSKSRLVLLKQTHVFPFANTCVLAVVFHLLTIISPFKLVQGPRVACLRTILHPVLGSTYLPAPY